MARHSGGRAVLLDLSGVTLAWLTAALLLRPFQNTPFIDDWVYAWAVERLLKGGDLRVLDYTSALNPLQILWGTLFCLPFGFSFTALRVSTWVLGLMGLWGLYVLLRDQGVARRDALLGTACLGSYPIYFVLSFTFMTDVPFVACAIGATLAFLRALHQGNDRWLWTAIGLSGAAIGIRVMGGVLPIAMATTLLMERTGWGRRRARFLWPTAALVLLAAMTWWFQGHVEVVADLMNSRVNRVQLLREYGLQFLPIMSVVATTFLAQSLGLALLPVSAGVVGRHRLAMVVVVCGGLGVGVAVALSAGHSYPPLTPGETWWLGELGATEPLVPNYEKPAPRAWWIWLVIAVTLVSASVLVTQVVRRRLEAPHTFLLLQVFGQFLLVALLWLFYDRYALVLIPVALVLTLRAGPLVRPWITATLVVVFGVASLVGMRDHLQFNRALWTAVAHLELRGIAPADFDGGYVVNGWLQYAHPERARRDSAGAVQVPHVNVSTTPRYRISNQPTPGWQLLAAVPYTRWAGRSGNVYVLEHSP